MRWTRWRRMTSAARCGRRSRVVLTPRRWCQVLEKQVSRETVAKKPGHRGERVISRKPLRREGRIASAEPVCSCAFSLCTMHARPRVQRAPGFPYALSLSRAAIDAKLGRIAPRECGRTPSRCMTIELEVCSYDAAALFFHFLWRQDAEGCAGSGSMMAPPRHSGALRSIEPGISELPGLVLRTHPGMTDDDRSSPTAFQNAIFFLVARDGFAPSAAYLFPSNNNTESGPWQNVNSRLGAFMRPVSIHTGAWRYPGAWPDANFNFAHIKRPDPETRGRKIRRLLHGRPSGRAEHAGQLRSSAATP